MIKRHLALIPFTAALLAGCAATGSSNGPVSTAPVAAYSEALSLSGKMSATYTRDGTPGSVTVNFEWRQTASRTDIELSTPLGSTVAKIAVTPEEAVLSEGDNKPPRRAASIDELSAQALGWPLPVSGLREWLQGHAIDAKGQRFTASAAHSTVTTQDGWQLSFVSWQPDSNPPRPRRIDAERAASGPVSDITIRVVIDAAK
ncbi:outer membrane lipoprotein LolB [Pseudoduganella rhizocola]|uniref:outer membrane lipoprotein LolB n=1 Tax=Pseudoduganella rhizocola TaxID=3382643 RepID=UPI0038B6AE73